MSDSDREVRPVWLTREQRDVLADWTHDDESGVPQVVAAWDAAPADPIEAAFSAYNERRSAINKGVAIEAVLRALGMPDA